MNTPKYKQRVLTPKGTLSAEDKERLIENLDIEVTNHRRKYEAFLEQLLEGFSLRYGMEITRIPKSIRQIKLREFDSYGGNVHACVQAITRQRMAENDGEGHAKKRKWQAALLEQGQEEERASKTPRLVPASPTKATPKRPLFSKPIGKAALPSAKGTRPPVGLHPKPIVANVARVETSPSKPVSRPVSPVKYSTTMSQFKPASTVFNPILPPRTPTYPRRHARHNETVMSVNGTPLVLPRLDRHDRQQDEEEGAGDSVAGSDPFSKPMGTRTNGFIVRRDPSCNPSYSLASTSTAVSSHSHSSGALITVATSHGQTVQFDPLATSPGSLDRIPDLTESAKKRVREDTARIIQALGKWRL